jgi:hypothetical protein
LSREWNAAYPEHAMRGPEVKTLMLGLFFGGLIGLLLIPRVLADRIRDLPLGPYWVAWAAAPACLLAGWLAVPWLVRLQGGSSAVDEDMQRDAETARRPPNDTFQVPLFSQAVAWLTTKGVEGSLKTKSPRRRYGHLAIMPFPALLLLSIVVVESANHAYSGPYEDARCMVVRSWKYKGETNLAFACQRSSGEALEEGVSFPPLPARFTARVRRGALGVWLFDRTSVRDE